jgi:mannosyltransferase
MRINKLQRLAARLTQHPQFHLLLLAVITALAAVLRLYKLGEWSFWIDEIFTINRAQGHFNIETLLEQWWRPPFSVILTGVVLQVTGISEWNARIVPAVIGIISVPIIYFPVKSLFGSRTALIASALLAISPWHLFWSQNARFYTSMMIFYFLAAISFYLYIEKDRFQYLVNFFIFFFFALSERFNAILLIPVLVAYLILLWYLPVGKPNKLRQKMITAIALLIAGFALLEIYSVLTAGITQTEFAINTFFGNPIDDPIRIFILTIFSIGVPVFVLGFTGSLQQILRMDRQGLFFTVNALLPMTIVLTLSPFIFTVDRYLFISLPFWVVLCASFVSQIAGYTKNHAILFSISILLVLLADAFGSHLLYYQINHGNRPDWRQAFTFVQERKSKEDLVVTSVPEVGNYYLTEKVIGLGDLDVTSVSTESQKYWFVLDSENAWWTPREKLWVENHATLLDVFYLRVRENINLRVYVYDP